MTAAVITRVATSLVEAPRYPDDAAWRAWVSGWPEERAIVDPRRISGLSFAAHLADAAYESDATKLRKALVKVAKASSGGAGHGAPGLVASAPELVSHRPAFGAVSAAPAHYIALDHVGRRVVLVVRGVAGASETAVMVAAGSQRFRSGFAHTGLVTSAAALWAEVRGQLAQLMQGHPGYSLLCVGHSLGAPAAALAALSAREEGMGPSTGSRAAHAVAFAPPAFVSASVRDELQDVCESVVCGEDFVPRIHLLSLERLKARIKAGKRPGLARSSEEEQRAAERAYQGSGQERAAGSEATVPPAAPGPRPARGEVAAAKAAAGAARVGAAEPQTTLALLASKVGSSVQALAASTAALLALRGKAADQGSSANSHNPRGAAEAAAGVVAATASATAGGFNDALTRFQYVPPGNVVFLRPARWYADGAPVSGGPPLVEFPACPQTPVPKTYLPGDEFCVEVPGAVWPHAALGPVPAVCDGLLGDLILTDSMLGDHLLSNVTVELDHLLRGCDARRLPPGEDTVESRR